MSLRNSLIKLAFENPSLRKDLLPLITREAADEVDVQKQLKVDADPKSKDENKPSEWYGLAPKGIQAGAKSAGRGPSPEVMAEEDLALKTMNALGDETGLPVRFTNLSQTSIPVRVPAGFSSLFESIEIYCRWDGPYCRISWSYEHNRGSNGYEIGWVSKDPKNGRWGWRSEAGSHGYVS